MRHHDLIIVGAGSGNTFVDESFADWDIGIVERARFGGTCLNAGCIPTKMFAHTADVAGQVRDAARFGLDASFNGADWAAIRDRVFGRTDEVGRRGREHRLHDCPNTTVYRGQARFTGPRELRVEPAGQDRAGQGAVTEITARHIVLAAGARPVVPEPVASAGVPFETSSTIMHTPRRPGRLAILGGGYVAAEFAHIFAGLGSRITLIEMGGELLAGQDESVVAAYSKVAGQRYDVRLRRQVTELAGDADSVRIVLDDGSAAEADMLLVAAGRVSNADELGLEQTGVKLDDAGRVTVDAYQRTTADGIWALGDISSPVQLKHVANRQAKVVAHNLLHPDRPVATDMGAVPAAIFTDPQIAAVGRTEQDCRDQGLDYAVGMRHYRDVAYGWALQDTTGFCKVLAERGSGRLLGAHILGPEASTLIQPLVVAISCDLPVHTLARKPYWIHPALTEVVENALFDTGLTG